MRILELEEGGVGPSSSGEHPLPSNGPEVERLLKLGFEGGHASAAAGTDSGGVMRVGLAMASSPVKFSLDLCDIKVSPVPCPSTVAISNTPSADQIPNCATRTGSST